MIESKYKVIGDNLIFKETFNSDVDILKNGGTNTAVTLNNGIATFTAANTPSIVYGSNSKYKWQDNDFSIRARIRNSSAENFQNICNLYKTGTNDRSWTFYLNGNGDVVFITSSTGANTTVNTWTPSINNGAWRELVLTKSGTVATLYVDGAAYGSTKTCVNNLYQSAAKFSIGAANDGTGSYNDGEIDVVELYNKKLTAQEVSNLYNRSQYSGLVTKGLQGYWDFTKGSSFDRSNNGNNGTDTLGSGGYKHGLGLDFDNSTTKVEVGNLNATIKTIIVVAKLNTTTEELIDLDGTNKMTVTAGTLACGGFAIEYVDGVVGTTVGNALYTFMACTDATGVSASDFDIGENSFDGIMKAIVVSTEQFPSQL